MHFAFVSHSRVFSTYMHSICLVIGTTRWTPRDASTHTSTVSTLTPAHALDTYSAFLPLAYPSCINVLTSACCVGRLWPRRRPGALHAMSYPYAVPAPSPAPSPRLLRLHTFLCDCAPASALHVLGLDCKCNVIRLDCKFNILRLDCKYNVIR